MPLIYLAHSNPNVFSIPIFYFSKMQLIKTSCNFFSIWFLSLGICIWVSSMLLHHEFVPFLLLSNIALYTTTTKSLQSCPTQCNPIDSSPTGSPIPGILQARTLEWVAISFSNAWKVKSESDVAQSFPTLSNPMHCSPPGSSVHGIFQAKVLEWGAIAFSMPCIGMSQFIYPFSS